MCVWEGEGVLCVGEGVCVLRGEFNMIHIEFTPYTHHINSGRPILANTNKTLKIIRELSTSFETAHFELLRLTETTSSCSVTSEARVSNSLRTTRAAATFSW